MELRYRLAVVTGAGSDLARAMAIALSRAGAAVVAVDPDLRAAELTAALAREARVRCWCFQADAADPVDRALLAARVRDLGGADVLVDGTSTGCPSLLEDVGSGGTELVDAGALRDHSPDVLVQRLRRLRR